MQLISEKIKDAVANIGKESIGLTSGITKLDEAIRGFRPANLYLIGGRSSMGKTSLALDISLNVSKDCPVMLFSLEMNFARLQLRALCQLADVNHHRVCLGKFREGEPDKLKKSAEQLKNHKLFVDDTTTNIYPDDYTARYKQPIPKNSMNTAIEKAVKFGCKLVVIDYLQLIRLGAKTEAEYLRLHEITWQLHTLAKRYEIPIILASQLARFEDSRYEGKNPRPRLDDLKGSGDIENDSDIVILLHRPQYYSKRGQVDIYADHIEDDALLIIAKNRDGVVGDVPVRWQGYAMSWVNLEDNEI